MMTLEERIEAVELDERPRPLPIHRMKDCGTVHPDRGHAAWWKAVEGDREQQMRDHWPLWDQLGVVDPAREPSS